jgi:threonyl-tRNA synthetase
VYAATVLSSLKAQGLRADIVWADESLGNRIRKAKGEKLPYVLVVGDDDVANATVGVNARGNEVERDVALTAFTERVTAEVAAFRGI